jgi:hypothetical protein
MTRIPSSTYGPNLISGSSRRPTSSSRVSGMGLVIGALQI